jgi:hypothetical protein
MLNIYALPTFDKATRTLGVWLTFHKPPSRTVPAMLRQKGDRNYRVCLAVYAGQEQTARIGEWNYTFRRRAAKGKCALLSCVCSPPQLRFFGHFSGCSSLSWVPFPRTHLWPEYSLLPAPVLFVLSDELMRFSSPLVAMPLPEDTGITSEPSPWEEE